MVVLHQCVYNILFYNVCCGHVIMFYKEILIDRGKHISRNYLELPKTISKCTKNLLPPRFSTFLQQKSLCLSKNGFYYWFFDKL